MLVLLGLVELAQGIWATDAPMGYYLDFPGFRSGWAFVDLAVQ
ncbi:hypothetical protein [Amycolatopsis panacis]|nr:hypothetical protein [Amycolatopsis panacis]